MKEYNGKKYPNWMVRHLILLDGEIRDAKQLVIKLEGNKQSLINSHRKEKFLKKQKAEVKEE